MSADEAPNLGFRQTAAALRAGAASSFKGQPPIASHAADGGRIALFLPSLQGGGAERAFVNLANQFVEWDRPVDVVLARASGPYLQLLNERARLVDLACSRKAAILPALVGYLRRERPAVLMTAMDAFNVTALLGRRLARVAVPVVVTCHVCISGHARLGGRLRDRALPFLARLAYPAAAAIVAVSEDVAKDLVISSKLRGEAIAVIPNPAIASDLAERAAEPLDHPWFVPGAPPVLLSVGRLAPEKDYATLLHAFARTRRSARLVILGEGPERPALERLGRELGVADALDMPGFVDNPFAYLARARLFVLSSRWEGFGMALVEALACGCPVVSTDCPGGPAAILCSGRFGRLVPIGDVAGMANAIETAMDTAPNREMLMRRAADFAVPAIAQRYLALLDRCTAGRGREGRPARQSGGPH